MFRRRNPFFIIALFASFFAAGLFDENSTSVKGNAVDNEENKKDVDTFLSGSNGNEATIPQNVTTTFNNDQSNNYGSALDYEENNKDVDTFVFNLDYFGSSEATIPQNATITSNNDQSYNFVSIDQSLSECQLKGVRLFYLPKSYRGTVDLPLKFAPSQANNFSLSRPVELKECRDPIFFTFGVALATIFNDTTNMTEFFLFDKRRPFFKHDFTLFEYRRGNRNYSTGVRTLYSSTEESCKALKKECRCNIFGEISSELGIRGSYYLEMKYLYIMGIHVHKVGQGEYKGLAEAGDLLLTCQACSCPNEPLVYEWSFTTYIRGKERTKKTAGNWLLDSSKYLLKKDLRWRFDIITCHATRRLSKQMTQSMGITTATSDLAMYSMDYYEPNNRAIPPPVPEVWRRRIEFCSGIQRTFGQCCRTANGRHINCSTADPLCKQIYC